MSNINYPYGPCVRVRSTFGPILPFTDIVVEVKDIKTVSKWREIARFNDESSMALVDADIAARNARRSLLEGEII